MGCAGSCISTVENEVSVTVNEETNPYATSFTKKERDLLRDTWMQLTGNKQIIGGIMLEIMDLAPELRPVFGVERVPRAAMLQMPKMGAHVTHFVEVFDQMTTYLGLTDNCLGAWQYIRKAGRAHASRVPFLAKNTGKDYFELFCKALLRGMVPYLTGKATIEPEPGHEGKPNDPQKRVRFSNANYNDYQIEVIWSRFMMVNAQELRNSFATEEKRINRQHATNIMVPQQGKEDEDRKMKKQKRAEMESKANPKPNPENGHHQPQMEHPSLSSRDADSH